MAIKLAASFVLCKTLIYRLVMNYWKKHHDQFIKHKNNKICGSGTWLLVKKIVNVEKVGETCKCHAFASFFL